MTEINRFRIEGKGDDKTVLADFLASTAVKVINVIDREDGEWECTDDAITQVKAVGAARKKLKKYQGRMVFLFHREATGNE